MSTEHIIALLMAERDKLDRAIAELGGIVKKRRGRPPKNPVLAVPITASNLAPAKSHHMRSAAARKAQAARMRAYWAKRKKAARQSQA